MIQFALPYSNDNSDNIKTTFITQSLYTRRQKHGNYFTAVRN